MAPIANYNPIELHSQQQQKRTIYSQKLKLNKIGTTINLMSMFNKSQSIYYSIFFVYDD